MHTHCRYSPCGLWNYRRAGGIPLFIVESFSRERKAATSQSLFSLQVSQRGYTHRNQSREALTFPDPGSRVLLVVRMSLREAHCPTSPTSPARSCQSPLCCFRVLFAPFPAAVSMSFPFPRSSRLPLHSSLAPPTFCAPASVLRAGESRFDSIRTNGTLSFSAFPAPVSVDPPHPAERNALTDRDTQFCFSCAFHSRNH